MELNEVRVTPEQSKELKRMTKEGRDAVTHFIDKIEDDAAGSFAMGDDDWFNTKMYDAYFKGFVAELKKQFEP